MTVTTTRSGLWAGNHWAIDSCLGPASFLVQQAPLSTAVAWGTANRAVYIPVRVPRRCVVVKLGYGNGTTATGNIDVGLYDANGTRLVSTGSQAKVTTSQTSSYDVTDTTIGPGLYYLALNNSTTTDTFHAYNITTVGAFGVLTEALGSVTLPATATWAVDNTGPVIPSIVAFTSTVVV